MFVHHCLGKRPRGEFSKRKTSFSNWCCSISSRARIAYNWVCFSSFLIESILLSKKSLVYSSLPDDDSTSFLNILLVFRWLGNIMDWSCKPLWWRIESSARDPAAMDDWSILGRKGTLFLLDSTAELRCFCIMKLVSMLSWPPILRLLVEAASTWEIADLLAFWLNCRSASC